MLHISVIDDSISHLEKIITGIQNIKNVKEITSYNSALDFLSACYSNNGLPQIVITDIEMPDFDGIALTDFLTLKFPSIKVIGITNRTNKELIEDVFSCSGWGIIYKGFTNKNADLWARNAGFAHVYENIYDAVNLVAWNRRYIDPYFKLLHPSYIESITYEQFAAKRNNERISNKFFGLTDEEEEIIYLYAGTNLSKSKIASLLSISEKKVEAKITSVYNKLGVTDRSALVRTTISKNIVKNARGLAGAEPL